MYIYLYIMHMCMHQCFKLITVEVEVISLCCHNTADLLNLPQELWNFMNKMADTDEGGVLVCAYFLNLRTQEKL